MPSWRRVFTSDEAKIEEKAGACPPGCETCNGSGLVGDLQDCGDCAGTGFGTVHPGDHPEHLSRAEQLVARGRDWPLPSPPPFPADDEDDEAPDE